MNLRVLFVEDSIDDVELMLRRLREAGIEPHWDHVQTEAALRASLAGEPWELALVDYNLPGFGGPQALAVLAEAAPDVPAITVSGAISEDTAVATLTAGAVDYVLKDNLTRLAPAVRRAVEGAELRRQQRRAAAQARQTMYAIEHSSQAIIYVSEGGGVLYANEAARGFGGGPPAEAVGERVWSWVPTLDEQGWGELWRAAAQHPIVGFEAPVRLPGGEQRLISATLDYQARGQDSFVIVYARDITEQREVEERAAESEARYARLADNAADIIFRYDFVPTMGLRYINPAVEVNTGYTPADCYADPQLMLTMVHPDDAARMAEMMQSLKPPDEPMLMRWIGKDGVTRWMECRMVPVRDAEGRLLAVEGITRDVTRRQETEEALRASQQILEGIINAIPVRVFWKDKDLVYLGCNAVFARDSGFADPKDIIGKDDYQMGWRDQAELYRADDRQVIQSGCPKFFVEEPQTTPSGDTITLLTSKMPLRDVDGEISGVLGTYMDITERKQAEEEIRLQAEQLRRTVEGAVLAMSRVVETRDPYTAGHERRVSELATAIAVEQGMSGAELTGLRLAGLIHDIGKIAVPAEILAKPGRLSEVEFNLIKQHPASGFDILEAIDFGRPVAEMVLQHHERLDGSGYPQALRAAEILPEARILAVADVVEAMSSHRPYRAALGMAAALAEIREHAGVKYDAAVVAACVRLVEEQGFAFTP